MHPQKRIKTVAYDIRDLSDKKQKKDKFEKSIIGSRNYKQSDVHIKSVSKDITPKKMSVNGQRSKYKYQEHHCVSNAKMIKSKQLTSVCSYSAIDKQSIPATKRKASNTISVKKKRSKNNQQIHESLKNTVCNFGILTKCLTQYIKQEKKKGKDPSAQILQLIKAFNRSEVAPLSKQLELLIANMLDYIQNTVGMPTKASQQDNENIKIKSRSSFSSASQRQIVYSQIFQNSFVPSTIKKAEKQRSNTLDNNQVRQRQTHEDKRTHVLQNQKQKQSQSKLAQHKKFNKQLQKQIKEDLKNMHDQLHNLKSAGKKLQNRIDEKSDDRAKLQQIYNKNRKVLENINSKPKFQSLNQKAKTEHQFQQQQEQSSEQAD